jgi:hypothetical protein
MTETGEDLTTVGITGFKGVIPEIANVAIIKADQYLNKSFAKSLLKFVAIYTVILIKIR